DLDPAHMSGLRPSAFATIPLTDLANGLVADGRALAPLRFGRHLPEGAADGGRAGHVDATFFDHQVLAGGLEEIGGDLDDLVAQLPGGNVHRPSRHRRGTAGAGAEDGEGRLAGIAVD